MDRELLIQGPEGATQTVPLTGRLTVGRSSAAELSFPEDGGLSRQHFAFEPDGENWTVQDLGSKNGTYVNDIPLKAKLGLKPGDRITAGHLAIVFAPYSRNPDSGVVVFDGEGEKPSMTTVTTSLEGASQTMVTEKAWANASAPMQALIRAGQVLSENKPLTELFPVILDLAIQAVNAQRAVLLILEGGVLVPRAHKGDGLRISTGVRDRVMYEGASVLVRDAQTDEDFRSRMSIVQQKVHSMMAVPLQTKDRIIGLIYLDSPHLNREFTQEDLSLLTVMANVAAIRIENARLAEVEQAERIMARDLTQAAEIQRGVLPARAPQLLGVDLAGYNAACRTVGGDYYDFFPYPDGCVGLALGDVSGKGMPASLMMMALHARVQVLAEDPGDLGNFMSRLNKATCANCPNNRFITFFFCVLNASTGEVRFANAGHNPPIVIRKSGPPELLEDGGPPLGIVKAAPYAEQRVELGPDDLLVLYSDGVTEATNGHVDKLGDERFFGEERFIEVLRRHQMESAEVIVEAVTAAMAQFADGAPPADDITLVVAKRL